MPNNKKDITGNVAPATGIPNKLLYISFIVPALLKYLTQYISYNIISKKAINNITVRFETVLILKSLNINEKQVTDTSPIRSNSFNTIFSFFTYLS